MKTPIEKYKKKVIDYHKFLMECHKRYGDNGMKSPMMFFDNADWQKIQTLSDSLGAIEDVLSITSEQQKVIEEECKKISGLNDTWNKK